MGKVFAYNHKITSNETDVTQKINIGKMVDLMMLASEKQGNELGVGEKKVNELGYGWVVTQHLINIIDLPQINQEIKIWTKADSYNKYFTYRKFGIEDMDGNELVTMETIFVLMDFKNRKISSLIPELIDPYEAKESKKLKRFPTVPKEIQVQQHKEYTVRFMDIDSNKHVNNAHYFDWMLDSLDYDFLTTNDLKTINIQYKNEVRYGQKVESEMQLVIDDNQKFSLHRIQNGENISCIAQCFWK